MAKKKIKDHSEILQDYAEYWQNEVGDSGRFSRKQLKRHSFKDPVTGRTHYLIPEAREAWQELQKAAMEAGHNIGVTNAYRDYDTQAALKKEKPENAATPGASKHGWLRAVDINYGGGAIEKHPEAIEWMMENAPRYGFARTLSHEPWHYEFIGYGDAYNPALEDGGAKRYHLNDTLYGRTLDRLKREKAKREMPMGTLINTAITMHKPAVNTASLPSLQDKRKLQGPMPLPGKAELAATGSPAAKLLELAPEEYSAPYNKNLLAKSEIHAPWGDLIKVPDIPGPPRSALPALAGQRGVTPAPAKEKKKEATPEVFDSYEDFLNWIDTQGGI